MNEEQARQEADSESQPVTPRPPEEQTDAVADAQAKVEATFPGTVEINPPEPVNQEMHADVIPPPGYPRPEDDPPTDEPVEDVPAGELAADGDDVVDGEVTLEYVESDHPEHPEPGTT